ncbi:MAG: hypothetical protein JXX28_01570 [Deltaproteobacteria bacterium]|nr:hypothetical protein [Deltaproteobacteria bacterium]
MGYSSWSDAAYRSVARERATTGGHEVFRGEKSVDPLMDPRGLGVRESRDSEHHPDSVPIIVAFDVTGSMGHVPQRFAGELLGRLMRLLVEEGWVVDPQVLFAAIGDAVSDRAPLQVGQFESGLEMDMWLTRLWLERGGGDIPESYTLAHWFARHHTATDAWEKRRRRGYLFTIGDADNKPLHVSHLRRVFGGLIEHSGTDLDVVRAAAERYHVFHIHLDRRGVHPEATRRFLDAWQGLVGDGLLVTEQPDAICELIGVAIGLTEGRLDREASHRVLIAAGMGEDRVASALERLAP